MDELEAIKTRAEAATGGPWIAEYSGEQGNCVIPHDAQSTREAVAVTRLMEQQADAEFIAHARTDIPKLVAALEAVQELSRIRQALGYPVSPGEIQHVIGEALGG